MGIELYASLAMRAGDLYSRAEQIVPMTDSHFLGSGMDLLALGFGIGAVYIAARCLGKKESAESLTRREQERLTVAELIIGEQRKAADRVEDE